MNIEQLNAEFGIPDGVSFTAGKGGLPCIEVRNDSGSALISVYAGQVLSFKPVAHMEDLLFLSDKAYFQPGKAIKGGVPICWPWFGPDPEGLGRPAHGFVRNRPWSVLAVEAVAGDETRLLLGLQDSPETQAVWPQAFELRLEIRVGACLGLELATTNKGSQSCALTQALHTYFRIGDIEQVQVKGLEGRDYLDKVDRGIRKSQAGSVRIAGEVDRIYTGVDGELVVQDQALGRRIRIASSGSATAVVWNPWSKIAAEMADLEDDDYKRMLCVETANAADDIVKLAPGETCRLGAKYRIEEI